MDEYIRVKCAECINKDKNVLDMPCVKCSAENDYIYFNAYPYEYDKEVTQ